MATDKEEFTSVKTPTTTAGTPMAGKLDIADLNDTDMSCMQEMLSWTNFQKSLGAMLIINSIFASFLLTDRIFYFIKVFMAFVVLPVGLILKVTDFDVKKLGFVSKMESGYKQFSSGVDQMMTENAGRIRDLKSSIYKDPRIAFKLALGLLVVRRAMLMMGFYWMTVVLVNSLFIGSLIYEKVLKLYLPKIQTTGKKLMNKSKGLMRSMFTRLRGILTHGVADWNNPKQTIFNLSLINFLIYFTHGVILTETMMSIFLSITAGTLLFLFIAQTAYHWSPSSSPSSSAHSTPKQSSAKKRTPEAAATDNECSVSKALADVLGWDEPRISIFALFALLTSIMMPSVVGVVGMLSIVLNGYSLSKHPIIDGYLSKFNTSVSSDKKLKETPLVANKKHE